MTREEIHESFNADGDAEIEDALDYAIIKTEQRIKSQTCENCNHGSLDGDHMILCNADFYDGKIYDTADNLLNNALFYPDEDFSCNKWESK